MLWKQETSGRELVTKNGGNRERGDNLSFLHEANFYGIREVDEKSTAFILHRVETSGEKTPMTSGATTRQRMHV